MKNFISQFMNKPEIMQTPLERLLMAFIVIGFIMILSIAVLGILWIMTKIGDNKR